MNDAAAVYGRALYELARDEGAAEAIGGELKLLQAVFSENPDFLRLLSSPNLSKAERIGVIDESFRGRTHPYVLNFMKLLVEKGRMRAFCGCCEVYRAAWNEENGVLPVRVVSARALTSEQNTRLAERLASLTGKRIELENRVDESCMGGLRIDYDGRRLDGTVSRRLERLHAALKNASI